MELYAYWHMVRRRWWIPLVLTGLVALISLVQLRPWLPAPVTYTASLRLLLGVRPTPDHGLAAYDPRYFAWLTSEYLVDDFTEVVKSDLFAEAVSRRLVANGIHVPAGLIQGSSNTGKQHRIITLTLGWGNRQELEAMAQAATAELEENAGRYFEQLGTGDAIATILDRPTFGQVGPDLRRRLEIPLRLVLALVTGVALLLLIEYLDRSVRMGSELEELGYTLLGEIPKHR